MHEKNEKEGGAKSSLADLLLLLSTAKLIVKKRMIFFGKNDHIKKF